jgi:hypothetical protein
MLPAAAGATAAGALLRNAVLPIPDVAEILTLPATIAARLPVPAGKVTLRVPPAGTAVAMVNVVVYVTPAALIVVLVSAIVGTVIALAIGATIRLLSMASVTATPNILENLFFIDLLFFLLGFTWLRYPSTISL